MSVFDVEVDHLPKAQEREEDLRIVLRIGAPELAALPWEAMYDTETGGYLCRQHQLVRNVPVPAAVAPLPAAAPLRLLGVVSAPRDLPPLAAARERATRTGCGCFDTIEEAAARLNVKPELVPLNRVGF